MDFADIDVSQSHDFVRGKSSADETVTEPGAEEAFLARVDQLTSTGEFFSGTVTFGGGYQDPSKKRVAVNGTWPCASR